MDFNLPDTALAVRDGVRAVGAKYDHGYWSRCDDEHRFPREACQDLAEGGWIGLCIPEEYVQRLMALGPHPSMSVERFVDLGNAQLRMLRRLRVR